MTVIPKLRPISSSVVSVTTTITNVEIPASTDLVQVVPGGTSVFMAVNATAGTSSVDATNGAAIHGAGVFYFSPRDDATHIHLDSASTGTCTLIFWG